jgi:glycosyltransferase involved in cell wall biosynthesis
MVYTGSKKPVSIVIPTKNAGPEFRRNLEAIRQQTLRSDIFVVDSGSTDGTLEIAREFEADITTISPESFNHGETRNLGVRRTQTPFCVMLVQDALPIGETWLEELISPFEDDRVVGVTAQQVPRPDSNLFARWQVEYRIQFLGKALRIQELTDWNNFLTLTYQERLRLASFDNVCSAVRRSFWEQHPFVPIRFAEDLAWGLCAIREGQRLIYNPGAQVIHSHNRPAAYHIKRSYVSGRVVPKLLHMAPMDNGVYNDRDFLRLLGEVCGEARTLVAERVIDWRAFAQSCALATRVREMFRNPIRRLRSSGQPANSMRANFYFILDSLLGQNSLSEATTLASVVPTALAEVAGAFTADYYNWCEAHASISDGLQQLDRVLSRGV